MMCLKYHQMLTSSDFIRAYPAVLPMGRSRPPTQPLRCIEDGIDGDSADDEGHVVHDGADESHCERQEVDVVDVPVAPYGYAVHGSHFDEDIHAESYAEEEHDGLQHLVLQAPVRAWREWLVGEDAFAVDDFVHHPQHSEHAQRSEEGGQAGQPVERRHEP